MKKLLFGFLMLITARSFSQSYQVKIFSRQAGYSSMTIEDATVDINGITLYAKYHNKYQTRTLEIPSTTKLFMPNGNVEFPLKQIIGASYGVNTFKSGKRYDIAFVVGLDWMEIMDYMTNSLFAAHVLGLQLTTNTRFQAESPRYGYSEWRYDFSVPLTYEQQLALVGGTYLSKLLVKNEFETTAQFNERTQVDSLKLALTKKMKRLATYLHKNEVGFLEQVKPTLSYSADNETFSITYFAGRFQPIKINVSLAEAKDLKDNYTAGRLKIRVGNTSIASNGTLIVHDISFVESSNKGSTRGQTYENILADAQSAEGISIVEKAYQEIVKKHPNGKFLK